MTTGIMPETRSILRSYSFEVEQRLTEGPQVHNLSQALVAERIFGNLDDVTIPWRAFFEPRATEVSRNPITDIIRIESAKLREKVLVFYNKFPKEELLDLRSFEPTIKGVTAMINAVIVRWQDKRKKGRSGKAMTFFHKFCDTLDSHSSLIKLLPDGNEYVSVFTGALNAIIKASSNHETIAEGFSEGLCTISEHIEEVAGYLTLLPTEDITRLVVDLYGHIFLFLSSVMDWLMKKSAQRLLDSFSDKFNDRFRNELDKIKDKVASIRNIAFQGFMAENRVIRLAVERLQQDVRLGLEGTMKHQAEIQLYNERIESRASKAEEDRRLESERISHLGGSVVVQLGADAVQWLQAQARGKIPRTAPSTGSASPFQTVSMLTSGNTAEDVVLNSRHPEDFFSRERVRLATDSFSLMPVSPDVILRLSEWAQDQHDPILWLEGPAIEADETENPLTSLAAKFIDLVETNELPVMSYFCEIPRTVDSNITREVKGTVSLLYALLRQMVELLLPRLETSLDLSEERFLTLDGTLDTWSEAQDMFRDLMSLAPGTVYCVVDGLHWLDDKTTDVTLAQLVDCLRGGRMKVLFTTSGRSGCLLDGLESEKTMVVGRMKAGDLVEGLDDHGVLG